MKKKKEVEVPKSRRLLSMAIEFAAQSERLVLLNDVDSAMGWTPVEEEPPEESGTLLVTRCNKLTGFLEVCVAQYWAVDKRFVVMRAGDVGIDLLDDVVAWMPFPEAYGGDHVL